MYCILQNSAFSLLEAILDALSGLATPDLGSRGGGRGRGKPLPRGLGQGADSREDTLSHLAQRAGGILKIGFSRTARDFIERPVLEKISPIREAEFPEQAVLENMIL